MKASHFSLVSPIESEQILVLHPVAESQAQLPVPSVALALMQMTSVLYEVHTPLVIHPSPLYVQVFD